MYKNVHLLCDAFGLWRVYISGSGVLKRLANISSFPVSQKNLHNCALIKFMNQRNFLMPLLMFFVQAVSFYEQHIFVKSGLLFLFCICFITFKLISSLKHGEIWKKLCPAVCTLPRITWYWSWGHDHLMEQMMLDSVCPVKTTKIFKSLPICWGEVGKNACLPDHRFGNHSTLYMWVKYPEVLFVFW